jgi:hypothetical protein
MLMVRSAATGAPILRIRMPRRATVTRHSAQYGTQGSGETRMRSPARGRP